MGKDKDKDRAMPLYARVHAREIIAFVLALVITVVVSGSALAQTGDMLRAVNDYGKEYRPFTPEQLRLPAPTTETVPDFAKDNYQNLVATKMVNGEYYVALQNEFSGLPKNLTDAQGIVIVRARTLCGINDSKPDSNQQRACYDYYYAIGKQAWTLKTIKAFNYCRGNIRSMLNDINEQFDIGNITNIEASVKFATVATAYKWCTVNFGQNLTVVPPTPENTRFEPPEGWEPVTNRTPDDGETIDEATAKEMLNGGNRKNATNATVAPEAGAAPDQSWVLNAVYIAAGVCVVVIVVAVILFVRKRKAKAAAHGSQSHVLGQHSHSAPSSPPHHKQDTKHDN